MSSILKSIPVLLFVLFLAGCAHTSSSQPYFEPPPLPQGKALVYMMRTQVLQGSFYDSVFSINDSAVVGLNNKTYSWVQVSPGLHKVSAGPRPHPNNVFLNLPVEPGKEYFVEYTQEYAVEMVRIRNAEEGKAMVMGYSYIPVK
ncbi:MULTISPECIES: DUF2846 domain-containing protein [unclassified Pseudomonas]|uniref:DUF2846 domain-containing protein n=1 Tax=Pseudomonas TaxID=286 RepID=UPI000595FA11|nr:MULTISPECIES: DUF2846 domain-containing protein [unclassified Pseudomonas]MBD0687673.1 DUF2846 domain-containing protein [Pseudomonas sp. PSB18]